jgi:hypothetical protein
MKATQFIPVTGAVLALALTVLAGPPVLKDTDTLPAQVSGEAVQPEAGPAVEDSTGPLPLKAPPKKKILGVLKACPEDMAYVVVDFNPKKLYEVCVDRYEYPNEKGKTPKSNVTWYMAGKLCKEQGKYLCWDKEWVSACLGPNKWDFSYYNVFDAERCNVQSDSVVKSGDKSQCKTGGYEVYDMVGNLREWVGGGGIGVVGGSYKNGRAARCSRWEVMSLQKTYPDVGFRCCAKLNTGRYGKVEKEVLKGTKPPPAADTSTVQKPLVPSEEKPAPPPADKSKAPVLK